MDSKTTLSNYLRKHALAARLGISPWTLDRLRTNPAFPQPTWINDSTPIWSVADVEAYLASRPRGGVSPSWTRPSTQKKKKKIRRAG